MTATPACLAYNALDGIENYAKPGALAIVDNKLADDPRVKAVRTAGGFVAIYLNFMEAPDTYGTPDRDLLYGGHPIREEWRWVPRRYNWAGSTMTDVRRGSAWWAHVFAVFGEILDRHPHITHVMADVQGDRLWSSVWSQMNAAERTAWTDGMNWAAPQLHTIAAARGVRIIVNGTQAKGNPNYEGGAIENHLITENAPGPNGEPGFWTKYLANPWGGADHVAYCKTLDEAKAWAKVPGIRWVALQPNGYAKPGPVWGPFPTPAPDPDPDPDPDPAPPPSGDPCAAVRAALAQANSDLNAARELLGQARDEAAGLRARIELATPHLDAARAALD